VDVIRDAERLHAADVIEIDLNTQFRLGGSEAYFHWVQSLLGLVGDGPIGWQGDERFELYVADSPRDMEAWLRSKNSEGFTARLTAGFCWEWSDPIDGRLVDDVVIGDWRQPWNLKPEKRVAGIPSSSLWASDPAVRHAHPIRGSQRRLTMVQEGQVNPVNLWLTTVFTRGTLIRVGPRQLGARIFSSTQ